MKIKCLLVMPGKEVQRVRIPANIKFIKALIGENLLNIRANENNIIIANQNARNDEFNRFFQGNILYGTFIVVSLKKNKRTSMKKKGFFSLIIIINILNNIFYLFIIIGYFYIDFNLITI